MDAQRIGLAGGAAKLLGGGEVARLDDGHDKLRDTRRQSPLTHRLSVSRELGASQWQWVSIHMTGHLTSAVAWF